MTKVEDVRLEIYEPPRFFEALLRGRAHTEPPDITARICGICPVAYQMSACQALEAISDVTVDGALRDLRLLLYYGEWIESHALHIYLLHAPDFLGYPSGVAMATDHRATVERGLALKKAGNELVAAVGGRAIHPVNVRLGGFYRAPSRADLAPVAERLEQALATALTTVEWVSGFSFPDVEHDYRFLALTHPDEYAILSGDVAVSDGTRFPVHAWPEHVVAEQVPHSTALHARLDGRPGYLTGPLARYALNSVRLSPSALRAAADAGLGRVCRNPFRSIVVRAVEIVHACEEALRLIAAYTEPDLPYLPVGARPGVGHGASEAPRGTLYHRYRVDERGLIAACDDEHLTRTHGALLAGIRAEDQTRSLAATLPALRPSERAALVDRVRATASPDAVARVLATAIDVLTESECARIGFGDV